MKKIFTLLFLFSFLSNLPAQDPFSQATLFDRTDGMPDNTVRAVAQGKDGFIWAGTSDGLCRFDGSQFKIWKHDPADPQSMPGSDVFSLLPTGDKIWVGTNNGLAALDLAADTFIRYDIDYSKIGINPSLLSNRHVSTIHQDSGGDLWVLFRMLGLFHYLPERDSFEHIPLDFQAAKRHFQITELTPHHLDLESSPANGGTIWVGTTAGLQEVNKPSRRATGYFFPHPNKDTAVWQNAFRRLHFHDDNLLYVGSWNVFVNVFDPRKKTFQPLSLKSASMPAEGIAAVGQIVRKNKDEIWITGTTGLLLYHTGRQEVVYWKKNDPKKRFYYGVHFQDERGRIWHSTFIGLYVFDPVMQQFSQHSYAELNKLEWGFAFHIRQLPGSDVISVFPHNADGFFHFDRRHHSWQKTTVPQAFIQSHGALTPNSVATDPAGNFTICSPNGLFEFFPKSGKLARFGEVSGGWGLPRILASGEERFGGVLWDRKRRLWLASNVLYRFDTGSGELRIYQKEWTTGSIRGLFEDSRGNVWFVRNGNIGVWEAAKDAVHFFQHFQQPERSIAGVEGFAEDNLGRVWAVGIDGMIGFAEAANPGSGIIRKIELDKQRVGSNIYGITTDLDGNAWVWAKKAFVKIHSNNLTLIYFSLDYSAAGLDIFSITTLPDGMFALGERNQITLVNPANLRLNDELPEPYLTEVRVQEKLFPGNPAIAGQRLRLHYWENFFSFAFSAKAFTMGKQVRFRYRLLGFQEEWTEAGERRFVNYTNVPGGDYVFQLQAANNEGVWNENLLELPVFVATAWWATWWFRILAALALLAAGWGIWRYRIGQIRNREHLKTEFEKRLANVEMSALLAQMNPHFLFNSLNSIDSYILKNQPHTASEYLNNFARLIRLILQRSRSNYVSLKDELEALELYIQMEALRFKDRFTYQILVQEGLETASLDIPPMLIQPFVENAIWHGLMHLQDRSTGRVVVSISRQNGDLRCLIEDNGIGRQRAMEIKAARSAGNRKSMGMRITEDRLEMINKLYDLQARVEILDLKNEAGEPTGTRVQLTIPV